MSTILAKQSNHHRAPAAKQRRQRPHSSLSTNHRSSFSRLVVGWLTITAVVLVRGTDSFCLDPSPRSLMMLSSSSSSVWMASRSSDHGATETRRGMVSRTAGWVLTTTTTTTTSALLTVVPSPATASPEDELSELRDLLRQANRQLESVPSLIRDEKWDGVRGALMVAPLRDCWSKSTPILKKYAEALGSTPTGDEFAALEGREELLQHLRFLDMAAYNNVFNPIASEGKSGATKALIDSYYNDPTREYDASKRAIEGLLQLSSSGSGSQP